MSKPTEPVERAKRDNNAIQFLDDHRYILDDAYRAVMTERDDAEREVENLKAQLAESERYRQQLSDGFDTAAEVERELAAYRERLRAEVEAMPSHITPNAKTGYGIDRADVLRLIGEMK